MSIVNKVLGVCTSEESTLINAWIHPAGAAGAPSAATVTAGSPGSIKLNS